MPCPLPDGPGRVRVSVASPSARPSPKLRRVGVRDFTFEAFSGFTRVTARWIAQPPKAAFVTRLQPSQLPDQTARQLPEQSTTLRVEPSSTGDTRRRGALGKPGLGLVTPRGSAKPRAARPLCAGMDHAGSGVAQDIELAVGVLKLERDRSRRFCRGAANLGQLELDPVRNVDPH